MKLKPASEPPDGYKIVVAVYRKNLVKNKPMYGIVVYDPIYDYKNPWTDGNFGHYDVPDEWYDANEFINDLVAENNRLREALAWYADQTHYLHNGEWKLFSYDNLWQRARDALKGGKS